MSALRPRPLRRQAVALAVLSVTTFLFVFDGLVVNLALPAMQRDLGLSQLDLQWVISSYTLPFAGLLLAGGRAGDMFGRRRVLVIGLWLFAAGLLGAGLARDPGMLFAARAVQGVGAAVSAPAALALISASFADSSARRRAFAVASVAGSSGAVAGAVLGGVITATLGWPWVFLVCAPVAAAAAAAAPLALAESRDPRPPPSLDLPGAMLATLGLASLVLGMAQIERAGIEAATTMGLLALALALLGLFGAHQAHARMPLLRPGLFRVRTLTAAALGIFANSGIYTALIFLSSLYLQKVLGYSALEAGVALVPMAVASAVAGILTARLLGHVDWRRVAVGGLSALVAAALLLARAPGDGSYAVDLLPGLLLCGLAVTAVHVPLTARAGDEVPAGEKGIAYGVFESATHVGGVIVLALVATATAAVASPQRADREGHAEALASGLQVAWIVVGVVALLGALAVLTVAGRHPARTSTGP
jgi:MFS family permease